MALREVLARFGFHVDDGALTRADKKINGVVSSIHSAVKLVAAGAAARAIKSLSLDMIKVGDEIGKTAAALGLSGEQLQRYRFAADRSGIASTDFSASLQRLQRAMVEAVNGNKTYRREFKRLGVSLKDGKGQLKSVDQVLLQVADGSKRLSSAAQRTGTLMLLMGRTGARMAPLFAQGSKGIKQMFDRFRELGGGLDNDFIKAAEAGQDAVTDYNIAMLSLKSRIATAVLPILTRLLVTMANVTAAISKSAFAVAFLKGALAGLSAILTVFGIKAALGLSPIIAPLLVIAATIALIVLIVDDVITAFRGGQSVLGELASEFRNNFLETFMQGLNAIGMLMAKTADAIGAAFTAAFSFVASIVVGVARGIASIVSGIATGIASVLAVPIDFLAKKIRSVLDFAAGGIARLQSAFNTVRNIAARIPGLGGLAGSAAQPSAPAVTPPASQQTAASVDAKATNNITVNAPGASASDADAIAARVKETLDKQQQEQYRAAFAAVSRMVPSI